MSKWKLFFLSLLLTTSLALGYIYLHRPGSALSKTPKMKLVARNIYLSSQLRPDHVPYLRRRGIKTIVDIRPDGEDENQATSAEMRAAAMGRGLSFHYIPVPHVSFPRDAVDALERVLTPENSPAILYCRTGNRAVRLFALAQASQIGGPGKDEIMRMVREAGFSADDLEVEINWRISHRDGASSANKNVSTVNP